MGEITRTVSSIAGEHQGIRDHTNLKSDRKKINTMAKFIIVYDVDSMFFMYLN